MALVDLWTTSKDQMEEKSVTQIVAFAGDGRLRDGGDASREFRQFLAVVPTEVLARYADQCLTDRFEGSGLVLQDIVNEVGRRLGFAVTHGRYRGGAGYVGYDGLWRTPECAPVVEVKTTDAYRLDLETVVGYRRSLIRSGELADDETSSILIIVGREDTGGLEAQIRGSRHAWDVRLISVDALLRLLHLKEATEDPRIHQQIRAVLVPREFTKLDGIIDLVFAAAEDVQGDASEEAGPEAGETVEPAGALPLGTAGSARRTPKFRPVAFHDACTERIATHLGRPLVKRSRATFASPDGRLMLVCAVSREHAGQGHGAAASYWFAFHPHQKEALASAGEAYIAFGCGSEKTVLLIPFGEFATWLDGLWTTESEERFYWHVRISREGDRLVLERKRGHEPVDLAQYLLPNKG